MKKTTKKVSTKGAKEEINKPKRYNALGEWINSPDWKPFMKIIDMKAVLK
jgi:hypothetical protein